MEGGKEGRRKEGKEVRMDGEEKQMREGREDGKMAGIALVNAVFLELNFR
jgi:hypothetical protein